MRAIIAAVNASWVIGKGNTIPWHYSEDLKRFKRLTTGGTVIMGRRTYESMGSRPLPGRRNMVITGQLLQGVEVWSSFHTALLQVQGDSWFIGGAGIYSEAMKFCDFIDLTIVPDQVDGENRVFFPPISLDDWDWGEIIRNPVDNRLRHRRLCRRLGLQQSVM